MQRFPRTIHPVTPVAHITPMTIRLQEASGQQGHRPDGLGYRAGHLKGVGTKRFQEPNRRQVQGELKPIEMAVAPGGPNRVGVVGKLLAASS